MTVTAIATKTNALDLQAHRCPTAMIMTRRAIEKFIEDANNGDSLIVQSIEPSLARDIPQFINAEYDNVSFELLASADIGLESIEKWQGDFDPEDWENTKQSCYQIKVVS